MTSQTAASTLKGFWTGLLHPRHYWLHLAALCVAGLLILTSPYAATVAEALNQQSLLEQNDSYLAAKEKEARDAVLVLAGLKGLYLTLASSQIGVSFIVDTQVTVGQLFAPFIDKLDDAEQLFSIAYGTTFLLQHVNKQADKLAWLLAVAALGVGVVYCLLRHWERRRSVRSAGAEMVGRIGSRLIYLFLLLYLLIPYGIHGSALVFQYYTQELKAELHQDVQNLHDQTASPGHHASLHERAEHVLSHFLTLERKVKHNIDTMTRYVVQHWVLWLLELLPLLLMPPLVVWLVRGQFHRGLGDSQQSTRS